MMKRYKEFGTPAYFAVLGCTILYILAFGVYFIVSGNTEFAAYIPVLLGLIVFVAATLPFSRLPWWLLAMISLLEALHLAGGGVKVHGDVLYNYVLIPIINNGENGITFWRYDQLVHPYGAAVAALVVYYFLAPKTTLKRIWIFLIVALAAQGVGALNEVLEFMAKIFIPHTDVGGYDNTALDLCSNLVGGVLGAWFAVGWWGKKPPDNNL